ncbi:MAG: putative MFS family arabinose efflux permease [Flavobacteriales bacterium]|jgi:predicted MFS family arabinose efflux permease
MTVLLRNYIKTFEGLSREIWWLALITFVNRLGAMVIPFLSIYLNESLDFSLEDIAWVMSAYGLGSLFGSWLGGKLTDQIGYYKVILLSLIFTGANFLWVMHVESFWMICISFFFLITLADMGRPAFFVALSAYSKPENKTRSLTLIRLAINLGMGAGPMLGGILIGTLGYQSIFYVDGITCLAAAILMTQVLHPKKAKELDKEVIVKNPRPPLKDFPYVIFLIALALFAAIFVPIFSIVPVFYRTVHELSEVSIGLIIGMNGLLIVICEMPLINWLQKQRWTDIGYTIFGLLLTGFSFLLLIWESWAGIVLISMLFLTVGEMISFPFSNKFALDRSKSGKQGAFMGLYTMSFSVAHIFGHNAGMQITAAYGFQTTWVFFGVLSLIAWGLLIWVRRLVAKESQVQNVSLSPKFDK